MDIKDIILWQANTICFSNLVWPRAKYMLHYKTYNDKTEEIFEILPGLASIIL